jgi:molecular chaperone HtpG
MQKGKVSVNTENLFPIIKKFLYTDNEIFLREIISNAVDASNKIKMVSRSEEIRGTVENLKITVSIDNDKKTITVSDSGIGMTAEEINKYINQIAFSGAEEYIEKFKDSKEDANIIGQFGLGFYSTFMVADKVEIDSLSYKSEETAARWTCEGSTDFKITKGKRKKRGTDIILHINEDSIEYLNSPKIKELLMKYCKFLPIDIEFEGETINQTDPIWKKSPSELTDEDYINFYNKLYPMAEKPLFWIHLNVDHPFNLTGVLYFPKVKRDLDPNKNKIQLYSNQVFVTDDVSDIVPEYLMLLHGVIDSPDIPLNVSRSSLQADGAVKKITGHISKKVSDKLHELYKNDRPEFEAKWDDIGLFVKYGMLSDEKFYDRATKFAMFKDTDSKYELIEKYIEEIAINQTDKDENKVVLYANDADAQYDFIQKARDKAYNVLLFNEVIDNHFIQHLEMKLDKVVMKRVDADTIDKLIDKDENNESVLNEADIETLTTSFKNITDEAQYDVQTANLSPEDGFVSIIRPEWQRRMKEMQQYGGGMNMFGDMPEKYNLTLNTNHPVAKTISSVKTDKKRQAIAEQALDLALLAQNMLNGEKLAKFIKRNVDQLK